MVLTELNPNVVRDRPRRASKPVLHSYVDTTHTQAEPAAAASALVDLSHLQETVVWLMNQLKRATNEIGELQCRRDSDIPRLQLQHNKLRGWAIEKQYAAICTRGATFGFEVS